MRLLLDTHALLWLAHKPAKLSAAAVDAIGNAENEIFASAVSALEIANKARLGKLEYRTSLATQFVAQVTGQGFNALAIGCDHAEHAGNLPGEHKDPWDRLLAAQAQIEQLTVITCDRQIVEFGVATLW